MHALIVVYCGQQASVHGVVFSGCGRYLVSLGKDKRLRKWDILTGFNLKVKFPEVRQDWASFFTP